MTSEPAAGNDDDRKRKLRDALPENDREAFDLTEVVETLADQDSITWLRQAWAPELATALGPIGGRAVGLLANQSTHLAGAITADAAHKAADLFDLCERWRSPVISLVDTPGFMVGPDAERTGLVRKAGAMMNAGARLTTPLVGVVLRRGCGTAGDGQRAGRPRSGRPRTNGGCCNRSYARGRQSTQRGSTM